MKFSVSSEVFEKLETVCFGIVVAKGIDNTTLQEKIVQKLNEEMKNSEERFKDVKIKELDEISYYREAFQDLGINPNKFMSSIEAMLGRVSKGKLLPNINNVVDLGNSISLKYILPLGAHDMDTLGGDMEVRFSTKGEQFNPLGTQEIELLDDGELIYFAGDNVRTRRWIWRQSEHGKITAESKNIFFPIDGFTDKNYDEMIAARNELAQLLEELFDCEVTVGYVDKHNTQFEIE